MGYTVIKASGNAYALNRSMQNLTPVDSAYRHVIPSDATFTYKHVTQDGICTLQSVDLKGGTQPYEYRLCDSQGNLWDTNTPRPGVQVNPINGVIILGENYDEQDVWVRLYPLIKTGYYDTNTPKIYVKAVAARDWSPVTPTHTASLDAIVYSFGDNLNWNSNSLTAAETQLTLTSVTVTYDGEQSTFSGNDLSNFATDVTDLSIVGMVDTTRIVNVTNNLRQFTIPANTSSSSRAIQFEVSFKYKGISVNYVLPNALMQAANVLSSVENAKYNNSSSPITLNVGTILNTNAFTATGNYSNGTSASIHPTDIKLNESSVNSVVEGEQTYTLIFGNNVTATFTITGQAAVTNKTHISDIAGTPYPLKIANTYEWPLHVNVVHGSNGNSEQLTFAQYNALNEVKETYASPEVTFTTNKQYYNMPSVNANGSLVYDFTADNYVYDSTLVTDISISCTSGGNNVTKDSQISYSTIKKHQTDTDYFTENFNEPISLSTSNYLTEFSGLTTHVSDKDSDTVNGHITLNSNSGGTVYILDKEKLSNAGIANDNFYIYVTGYQGAIISKSGDLTSGTYDKSTNVKVMWPDSASQGMYIHHTPTSADYTTYLVQGAGYNGSQAAKWYILTPKATQYGPITITSEISVSPTTLPASGGTVTITPPTYSQTHGSETIISDADITYTLDGEPVTLSSNNTISILENQTNLEKTIVLVATITLNGRTTTSSVNITQAANTSVTAPTIASIVSSDPYDIITGGTLVTNDNKEQVEFPLQITLSNGTSTTLEDYQNTYGANSLYSGVTIQKSSSSSDSVGAYPNDFKINSTNGNIIYDFKDDSFAWDRSKITSITINGKTGVPNVVLNSGISSIYAHQSSLLTPHFEEKLDWTSLSFTTSGTKYKLDISSDDGATRLGLQTSSSANRLKKLTAASDGAYYIRFRSTDWPTISVFELPQGTTISTDLDLRNVNKRVLRIGGSPSTVATDWKYIKLTPTTANVDIYYADNSSDGDVQLGSIKNN